MSTKSFDINKHVTLNESESDFYSVYKVETAYGYTMGVVVDKLESKVDKIYLYENIIEIPFWDIKPNSRVHQIVEEFGIKGLLQIMFYLGVDSKVFFKVKENVKSRTFYVDFYVTSRYSAFLFTDVEDKQPLAYCSRVEGVFSDIPVNGKFTLKDIARICLSFKSIEVFDIFPDSSIIWDLLCNFDRLVMTPSSEATIETLSNFPKSVFEGSWVVGRILKNCAKLVSTAKTLGFDIDTMIEFRPSSNRNYLPEGVKLWEKEWFGLWEHNLQLGRLKVNSGKVNMSWFKLYYRNLNLLYSNLDVIKESIDKRVEVFNKKYSNIQISMKDLYSSQNKGLVFYSILRKKFIKFLPYTYTKDGKEYKGIYELSVSPEISENLVIPDFESAIIQEAGIEPIKNITEPKEYKSSRITRKQMISESKEANKYLKREKDGYLFVISRDTDKDWGYKFRVSNVLKKYLSQMLGSGRMVDYWKDIYPFLENINKDGIGYLRKEKPEVLLDYAYKCTKFSGLIQKGNFISLVTKKDMDFSSVGLEDEIREVYREAVEREEKQEKERKRLEEIYGI